MNRSQRGTLLPILVLVLMSGLTLTRALMRQGMSPILATVPLRLDASREVDVALARRQGRLLIVNAGLVQAFDTRTGVRVYATRAGTPYTQEMGGRRRPSTSARDWSLSPIWWTTRCMRWTRAAAASSASYTSAVGLTPSLWTRGRGVSSSLARRTGR